MATLFGQKPSDIALLEDSIGPFGRFCFNRGIAAFGETLHRRVQNAGESSNPAIAQAQRVREWERIMGGSGGGSAAFRELDEGAISSHARIVGRDDDDLVEDGDDEIAWCM